MLVKIFFHWLKHITVWFSTNVWHQCLIPSPSVPPITNAHEDPCPFYHLWRHQFWQSRTTLSANLCRVKGSFKPYHNENNSVKEDGEKGKKPYNIDPKISIKIYPSSIYLPFLSSNPKSFKLSPPKWSSLNAQQNKKMVQKKSERRGQERNSKEKFKTAVHVTFSHLEILLPVHAQI